MLVTILMDMSRQHIIRLDLVAVVFLGGCVGTGLRYALSLIPEAGTFHIGTFTANMIACFAYATLSAWLGGAAAIKGRMKEYVNRGFGMGMCGGLSTMSTLALEEFTLLHGNAWPVLRSHTRAHASVPGSSTAGKEPHDERLPTHCGVPVWWHWSVRPLYLRFLYQSVLA